MKTFCPQCEQLIGAEDVNVAKDVAFCRKCNEAYILSDLVADSEEAPSEPPVDLQNPPRGAWYRQDWEGFEVGVSTRHYSAFFLVPFMLVWSGGSLGGLYGSQIMSGKFSLFQSLFGIPFLIGTIILGSIAVMSVVGKITVTVRDNAGCVFTGVGRIGWRRRFDWGEAQRVYETFKNTGKSTSKVIVIEGKERTELSAIENERRHFFMLRALQYLLSQRGQTIPGSPDTESAVQWERSA
ncbi:MAG TPA: hypothetical protein VGP72_07735 [Planctomycetota bacterium]|jgi:hypothetical protein